MKNKLKLFYIFMIAILLGAIVHLTNEMGRADDRFVDQNEVVNKHISRNHLYYLEVLKKNIILKAKNKELKHDVESMLEENIGLKHNYIHLDSENIALKKALTDK